MTLLKIIAVLGLVGVAAAGYLHGGSSYSVLTKHEAPHYGNYFSHGHQSLDYGLLGKYNEPKHYEPVHYPKYSFDYGVKDAHTGDQKSQWEHRDGDRVKGGYTLKEADGTTRIVEYTADDHSGFNAIVKNIGHAHHPQVYKKIEHHGHGADLHSINGYGGSLGGYSDGAYHHGHELASSYVSVKQHL